MSYGVPAPPGRSAMLPRICSHTSPITHVSTEPITVRTVFRCSTPHPHLLRQTTHDGVCGLDTPNDAVRGPVCVATSPHTAPNHITKYISGANVFGVCTFGRFKLHTEGLPSYCSPRSTSPHTAADPSNSIHHWCITFTCEWQSADASFCLRARGYLILFVH